MRKLILGLALALAAAAPSVAAVKAQVLPNAAFAGLSRSLSSAHVPLLIPRYVPSDYDPVALTGQAGTPFTKPGDYVIVIGARPGCSGGTACTWGTVSGFTRAEEAPVDAKPQYTTLRDHTRATFYERACTANCAGSFVMQFIRGGFHYEISLKAGKLEDAVLIANSLTPLSR